MQIFYKFFKIFKVFDKYTCAECPPNRNFGDTIAVQDLRRIHVWNVFRCSSLEPKSLLRPFIQYILYIYQLSLVSPPPIFIRGGPHEYVVLVHIMKHWNNHTFNSLSCIGVPSIWAGGPPPSFFLNLQTGPLSFFKICRRAPSF